DRQEPDRLLRAAQAVRPGGGIAAKMADGGQGAGRGRFRPVRRRTGGAWLAPAPAEKVDRCGNCGARLPGDSREETARRLGNVQHTIDARRRAPGPEEVRRGRTALV